MTLQPAIGEPAPRDRTSELVDGVHGAFSQVLSALFLAASLWVWSRVLGLGWFDAVSFEEATTVGRALMVAFAAALPVAALGLWFVRSWGHVLWLMAVAVHALALANGWMGDASAGFALGFHAVSIGLFACIQIARVIDARRVRRARSA